MCRILGYLGAPVSLSSLVFEPPCGLERQSHAPRHQSLGRINADGWGIGWYDPAVRAEPARYRTVTPMWADQRFRTVAEVVHAGCVLASVRNASPGAPVEETGSAPFTADRWLFTHNGFVEGFRGPLGVELRRRVSDRRAAGILGSADSEVLFALLLDRLDAGTPMGEAVAAVVEEVRSEAGGAYNVQLTDGTSIVATCAGNSLYVLERDEPAGMVVASEPWDVDESAWREVDDASLVTLSRGGVRFEGL